ncbi:MAG: DUF2178 domain-containing protein [Candidatus Buchananbacteria bacterium]
MTLKQYQGLKIAITIILAIIFSQAFVLESFVIPMVAATIAFLILILARKKVKGVVADERDYAIGGKAALLAMQVYAWLAVMAMFFFFIKKDINPAYEAIAMTLAYSTCLLMIAYGLIFRYYEKITFFDKKIIYTVIMFLIFAAVIIFGLRLLSGEDDWICQNGQWIKHGQPDFPAPTTECK